MREIAEARERMCQARDRGLGKAGARDELLISEQPFTRGKRAKNFETAGESDDEFSIVWNCERPACCRTRSIGRTPIPPAKSSPDVRLPMTPIAALSSVVVNLQNVVR